MMPMKIIFLFFIKNNFHFVYKYHHFIFFLWYSSIYLILLPLVKSSSKPKMIKFIIGMIIGGYIIHINPNIVNDIIILQQIRGG